MKKITLITFLLNSILISQVYSNNKDLYKDVTFHKMENGLEVILAANHKADTTMIELQVDAGTKVEGAKTWGVNHLLEHVLFADSDLADNQNYLQVIEEMGGTMNGSSSYNQTSYYATVPKEKSEWITGIIHKMIFQNIPSQTAVDRAKKSVLLEIGEPSWIADILGFWPGEIIYNTALALRNTRGIWEESYGYKRINSGSSSDRERLNTVVMSLDTVKAHYKNYYYPSNMRLFLAGHFDRAKMFELIQATFGKELKREGLKLPMEKIVDNGRAYIKNKIADFSQSTTISLGQKYYNISGRELITFQSYLDFLAHRLMKELRNRKGETYSANTELDSFEKAGYGYVHFETQNDRADANFHYLKDLINKEVHQGSLTKETFERAVSLSKKQRFELSDFSSNALMNFAQGFYHFKKEYNSTISPYSTINGLTYEEYKSDLKKIFSAKNVYQDVNKSYLFFKGEGVATFLLYLFSSIFLFKVFWGKKISPNDYSHSVDLAHTPGMVLEFIAFFLMAGVVELITFGKTKALIASSFPAYESNISPQFLFDAVESVGVWFFLFYCLSKIPTKVLLSEDKLILKSMAFSYREFPRDQIISAEVIGWWSIILKPSKWLNLKFRYFNLDPFFWRKGVLITFKNGKSYFVGCADSEHLVEQIIILKMPEEVVISKEAA